jgi:hypothetical protein
MGADDRDNVQNRVNGNGSPAVQGSTRGPRGPREACCSTKQGSLHVWPLMGGVSALVLSLSHQVAPSRTKSHLHRTPAQHPSRYSNIATPQEYGAGSQKAQAMTNDHAKGMQWPHKATRLRHEPT